MGQAAAAGVGAAGMQTGSNIANLLGQQGQAEAMGASAQNQFYGGIPGAITGAAGLFTGLGGFGSGGVNPSAQALPPSKQGYSLYSGGI